MILVHIYVFTVAKKKILRNSAELELLGNTRMSFLLKKALGLISDSEHGCRWYWTSKTHFSRPDLIQFEPEKMKEKSVGELAEETLCLIVTGPGTRI